jgi:hypothetical protein
MKQCIYCIDLDSTKCANPIFTEKLLIIKKNHTFDPLILNFT